MKIPEKLKSRKFILALIAILLILLDRIFGLDLPTELELGLVAVILAYIGGESWIDKKKVEMSEPEGPKINT